MSADNWVRCPKCDKKKLELKKKLNDVYGKVSLEEYVKLQDELRILFEKSEYTLREDYEQGILEGMYLVKFNARCRKCNFAFKYEYKQEV